MNCTICVAKTKGQISCSMHAQLICTFVFAKPKIGFSHDVADMRTNQNNTLYGMVIMIIQNVHCISRDNHPENNQLWSKYLSGNNLPWINSFKSGVPFMGHRQTE